MTQSFDEWLESIGHMDGYQHHYQDAYDTGYEVGAQSRQSEIDELKKRIDDAVKCMEQNKPSFPMDFKHAMDALSILKGKQGEK